MSDSSFSNTLKKAQDTHSVSSVEERNYWNHASKEARENILRGRIDYTDAGISNKETATENAYQQDRKAKLDLLISKTYNSLPVSVQETITESLVDQGVLPNPNKYKGIGQEYMLDSGDVLIECDRCDESFIAREDFDEHKSNDHGDDDEKYPEAEESYISMLNPDMPMERIREARRELAETDEGDLHRNFYFNGDELPKPTTTDPPLPKGKKGYNANPNAGLYDTKLFKTGKSTDRYGGVVSETLAVENNDNCPECGKEINDEGSGTQKHDELLSHLVDDHSLYEDDAIAKVSNESVTCQCGENFNTDDYYVHINETGHMV